MQCARSADDRRGRGLVILAAPMGMVAAFLFSGQALLIGLALIALFTAPLIAVALPGTKRWLLAKPPVPELAWPAEPQQPAA